MAGNFNFKEFLEELKETEEVKTSVEHKKEREYFLIVTEGEKTEPIYFEYFKNQLPKNLLETIDLVGEGANTTTVVRRALELKLKREKDPVKPNYNEVWAVFDRDSFPRDRVNEALELADQNNINCGFTNQAFELWYILHFQYLDAALHRDRYINILSEILGQRYTKNNEGIVNIIMDRGNVRQAITFAQRLEEMHLGNQPVDCSPYTTIHHLVEKLLEYCIPEEK